MRFVALDAWRGVAALLVALFHLSAAGAFYEFPPIRHGGIAVPFFFVLSGFVIAYAYGGRLNTPLDAQIFITRRIGRLFPLHLFTLGILVALELAKLAMVKLGIQSGQAPFTGDNSIEALAANLLLLHAVIPFGSYTWNVPSWSISTEFYTYFVFLACMMLFGAYRRIAIYTVIVGFGVLLLLLQTRATPLHDTSGYGLVMCIFGFFLGTMTYAAFEWYRGQQLGMGTGPELIALFLMVAMFWMKPFGDAATMAIFAICIFIFAFDSGSVSRVLAHPSLQFLGRISYSIYLVHFVILSILNGGLRVAQSLLHQPLIAKKATGGGIMISFGPFWMMDGLALIYLAVTIYCAYLTYIHIEERYRQFFNKLSFTAEARL